MRELAGSSLEGSPEAGGRYGVQQMVTGLCPTTVPVDCPPTGAQFPPVGVVAKVAPCALKAGATQLDGRPLTGWAAPASSLGSPRSRPARGCCSRPPWAKRTSTESSRASRSRTGSTRGQRSSRPPGTRRRPARGCTRDSRRGLAVRACMPLRCRTPRPRAPTACTRQRACPRPRALRVTRRQRSSRRSRPILRASRPGPSPRRSSCRQSNPCTRPAEGKRILDCPRDRGSWRRSAQEHRRTSRTAARMCSRTGCQPSKDSPPRRTPGRNQLRRKARCSVLHSASGPSQPAGMGGAHAAPGPHPESTPVSGTPVSGTPVWGTPVSGSPPSAASTPTAVSGEASAEDSASGAAASATMVPSAAVCDRAFEIGDDLVGATLGTAFRVDCRVAACVVRSALVSVEAEHLRAAPDARENREEQPEARPHHHAPCHASPARSAATYGTTCVLAALGEGTRRISHTPAAIPAAPRQTHRRDRGRRLGVADARESLRAASAIRALPVRVALRRDRANPERGTHPDDRDADAADNPPERSAAARRGRGDRIRLGQLRRRLFGLRRRACRGRRRHRLGLERLDREAYRAWRRRCDGLHARLAPRRAELQSVVAGIHRERHAPLLARQRGSVDEHLRHLGRGPQVELKKGELPREDARLLAGERLALRLLGLQRERRRLVVLAPRRRGPSQLVVAVREVEQSPDLRVQALAFRELGAGRGELAGGHENLAPRGKAYRLAPALRQEIAHAPGWRREPTRAARSRRMTNGCGLTWTQGSSGGGAASPAIRAHPEARLKRLRRAWRRGAPDVSRGAVTTGRKHRARGRSAGHPPSRTHGQKGSSSPRGPRWGWGRRRGSTGPSRLVPAVRRPPGHCFGPGCEGPRGPRSPRWPRRRGDRRPPACSRGEHAAGGLREARAPRG